MDARANTKVRPKLSITEKVEEVLEDDDADDVDDDDDIKVSIRKKKKKNKERSSSSSTWASKCHKPLTLQVPEELENPMPSYLDPNLWHRSTLTSNSQTDGQFFNLVFFLSSLWFSQGDGVLRDHFPRPHECHRHRHEPLPPVLVPPALKPRRIPVEQLHCIPTAGHVPAILPVPGFDLVRFLPLQVGRCRELWRRERDGGWPVGADQLRPGL